MKMSYVGIKKENKSEDNFVKGNKKKIKKIIIY